MMIYEKSKSVGVYLIVKITHLHCELGWL